MSNPKEFQFLILDDMKYDHYGAKGMIDDYFLERSLRHHYVIHKAATYDEALTCFHNRNIDIAILDYLIEGSNKTGLDLLRVIKDRNDVGDMKKTKAIIFTNYKNPEIIKESQKLGGCYVFKDKNDTSEFNKALTTLMAGGDCSPKIPPPPLPEINDNMKVVLYYIMNHLDNEQIADLMWLTVSGINGINTKLFENFLPKDNKMKLSKKAQEDADKNKVVRQRIGSRVELYEFILENKYHVPPPTKIRGLLKDIRDGLVKGLGENQIKQELEKKLTKQKPEFFSDLDKLIPKSCNLIYKIYAVSGRTGLAEAIKARPDLERD
jgi:DNA-binding NarL/FixJ family response regulator